MVSLVRIAENKEKLNLFFLWPSQKHVCHFEIRGRFLLIIKIYKCLRSLWLVIGSNVSLCSSSPSLCSYNSAWSTVPVLTSSLSLFLLMLSVNSALAPYHLIHPSSLRYLFLLLPRLLIIYSVCLSTSYVFSLKVAVSRDFWHFFYSIPDNRPKWFFWKFIFVNIFEF